jgi:hypothetical protein
MSEVKVNKISPRTNCGTVTVGDAGDSVTVTAGVPVTVNGDLKSNALKAVDGGSIISQCGTNITLGASGDTINLAAGASQTGFGRTGTVDWQTGSIKTATFTAANGEGYFANTSGGAFTMNLPAGSAGAIVSVVDYTNTFQTNNLTISPNGSEKIGGVQADAILSTEGQSVTFVYIDGTEGWKNVQDSTSNVTGNPFIVATGGTITNCGNCKIHTFTGPGTFTVCKVSCTAAENTISYLVIAGGGGGGEAVGGGGGAGGFREVKAPTTPYTASPLDGYPSSPNRVTLTVQAYPITVGGGGPGSPGAPSGTTGSNSIFSTITSAGGGGGARDGDALNGGSGGGGGIFSPHCGGSGNTPPTTPSQGNNGGVGYRPGPGQGEGGGGGGGASAVGGNAETTPNPNNGGPGGNGASTSITGSSVTRAGGGGGAGYDGIGGEGGSGGGGCSGPGNPDRGAKGQGTAGTTNTGSGGGAGNYPGSPNAGGNGGSGIVIIRYKFQ